MPNIRQALILNDLPAPSFGKVGWPWTEQSKPLPERMPDGSEWPRISIVTPNYNYGHYLEETIRSILLQNYPNLEYIIIDGGSTDNSLSIIQKYETWLAYWESEPDDGIYDAMNKGARLASGEWLIFMNAGDSFFSDGTLQELTPYLCSSSDVILGGVESVYDDKYGCRTLKSFPRNLSQLWCQIPTCHQSILVKRELQVKYPFDTGLSWCADHDFLAKLYSLGYQFKEVEIIISKFEASGNRERNLLSYTKERRNIYRRYFRCSILHDLYFMNEYRAFWIQQHINRRLREYLPKEWVIFLRKMRGIY